MRIFGRRLFKISSLLSVLALLVHGQDQSRFISLDCGLPPNSSYADDTTGINYISDASFIETGISKKVSPELLRLSGLSQQLSQVRSFPDGDRNCYNVELVKDTRYLIRAIFLYGNYDGLNKLPTFDLHIGPNYWVTIRIQNATLYFTKELIHVSPFNYISVCLVKTGPWTPFISTLEIRPLHNGTYVCQTGSLSLFNRVDVGSLSNRSIRFPDDVYDRFWGPFQFDKHSNIGTTETINPGIDTFYPPSAVMSSATIPTKPNQTIELVIDTQDNSLQLYVYIHFAEIEILEVNESRQFNISVNGKYLGGPISPGYLQSYSVYSVSAITGGEFQFSFFKIGNSTRPPLLNAFELYSVVQLSQADTDQAEVNAIRRIKSTYGIARNWQGDPCAPRNYKWQGLTCTYPNKGPPVIKALDLSSSGLTGEISSDIYNLKSLRNLDLSNNSLTGALPDFLSELPLKSLNLEGNNLTGKIPAGIFNKWKNGSLSLSISGNPELCESVSCDTNKGNNNSNNVIVTIVASIGGVFVLVVILAILFWRLKTRKRREFKRDTVELKKREFIFSEILRITNNLERVLGKGGFGTIYHGHLDGVEVAVKMLSPSSVQGVREFRAEVELLLRVHHKNLTSLVGYCDESEHLGFIYEYMANGNLKSHLSDGNTAILSWDRRLQIALEAAQGLEYLHNGCIPPIVHRDVKTTNILLNDKFQAKLADFGLSRVFPVEGESHVSTAIVGTPGYLDPEYYVTNWLTEKSDVFSFGVVLMEIITGKPVLSKTRDKTHLSEWIRSKVANGDIESVVDPKLRGDFDVNSLWKVIELAMACVSVTSVERPTMNQVVMELSASLETQTGRTQSTDELMSASVQTGVTPLAR